MFIRNSKSDVSKSYRTSHSDFGYGSRYLKSYNYGYYAAQWRDLERPMLMDVIKALPMRPESCLDFACGTGRISNAVAQLVPNVVGVDVSAEMLRVAVVPKNVTLVNKDITRDKLDHQFDVATAFRFFLNAEDELRVAALRALRGHLRAGGYLICNIHMSSSSPMGLIYQFLNSLTGVVVHKTLSREEFVRLLCGNGFSVERIIHYGFMPRIGRYLPALSECAVGPIERFAAAVKAPAALYQSFLVVARAD
jgi:SAM-dependent methyltransferase